MPEAVIAVIEAAGQRAPRLERPAGLTEREAEVVAMLARGLQTKQVARALGISVEDRGPPHPELVPQDRRLDPCRRDAVRHGARPGGMGRTPDCPAGCAFLASSLAPRHAGTLDKEETMTTETLAAFQTDNYEIAEAIAPTWERRREEIERVSCAGPGLDGAESFGRRKGTRCSSSPPARATPASRPPWPLAAAAG